MLLGKIKLGTTEVLISKTLVETCISHDEFLSVHNVLNKYEKVKEKTKNLENF